MKWTQEQQAQMFGTTIESFELTNPSARSESAGERVMLAMSIMSDAQEFMAFDVEKSRQLLNLAKYVLSTISMTVRDLDVIPEEL